MYTKIKGSSSKIKLLSFESNDFILSVVYETRVYTENKTRFNFYLRR